MCSSSPGRTPKLQLTAEHPSTGECWIPPEKDTPHPRAKEKPQQDGRRGEIALESHPIPSRDSGRDQTKPCVHQDPEAPQRLNQTRLSMNISAEAWVCSGLLWGQVLWLQQTWVTQHYPPQNRQADDPQTAEQLYQRHSHTVKKALGPTTDTPTWGSGKGTENLQGIRLWRPVGFDYRTSTGLGKQTLGGHKQNLVLTRSQEKGVWRSRSLPWRPRYKEQGENAAPPTKHTHVMLPDNLDGIERNQNKPN